MKSTFEPCCTVFQGKLLAMTANYKFFRVECLELENVQKGWSDWPSMRKEEIPARGRLTSAYSADDHVFVVRQNGSLDSFNGQEWHLGKKPEGWPEGWRWQRDCQGDKVTTTTVNMTGQLRTLIVEARELR